MADGWAAADEAFFLNGSGAEQAPAAGEVALTLSESGCQVTHAPAPAFEGFAAAARALTSSTSAPRALKPPAVRAWLRGAHGGELLLRYLTSLDPAARQQSCRALLAFLLSDVPTSGGACLNPPEEARSYSSVWGKDEHSRAAHARSTLDSNQVPPKPKLEPSPSQARAKPKPSPSQARATPRATPRRALPSSWLLLAMGPMTGVPLRLPLPGPASHDLSSPHLGPKLA